jgi:ribose 5-phosphate isomerase A
MEAAKRAAAVLAVQTEVNSGMCVGIGSGSTIVPAVEELGRLVKAGDLTGIRCVPSSFQAQELILKNGLSLSSLDQTPSLDLALDGADEVDPNFHLIKGGGGCLLLEKIVIDAAARVAILCDYRKRSPVLGTFFPRVPIEIVPVARVPVARRLATIVERLAAVPPEIAATRVHLRMATAKAGPCVTDEGNLLFDVEFGPIANPVELERELLYLPGVVNVGLFCHRCDAVYYGEADGTTTVARKLQ